MGVQLVAAWLGALQLVGLAVLLVAFAVAATVRRRSAATRRGVWALAIAVLLAFPFARAVLDTAPAPIGDGLGLGLVSVWAVGAALLLARLVHGVLEGRRWVRRARVLSGGPWVREARSFLARAELRVSADVTTPATLGLLRPVILIPAAMEHEMPTRAVLAHELAHVARADCLVLIAGAVARALFWINPLAWIALRRLREHAEEAADDAVLGAGVPSSSYAAQLVAVARSQLDLAGRVAAAGLRPRVTAILDPERARSRLTARARWSVPRLVLAAALLASTVTACEARGDHAVRVAE